MAVYLDLKGTTQTVWQLGKGGPKFQNTLGDFHCHAPNLVDYVDIFANVLRAAGNELVLNANAPNTGNNRKYTVTRPTSGMTQALTLHLPPNYGSSGQFLQSDGAGNTSWASAGGGASGFTELTGPVNLTGTYNGFLRVIGDATVTGDVTIKGDLKVTNSLINSSAWDVTVEGNAILGRYAFTGGGDLTVEGDLTTGEAYATLGSTTTQASWGTNYESFAGYPSNAINYTMNEGVISTLWFDPISFITDTSGSFDLTGDWTAYPGMGVGNILYSGAPGGSGSCEVSITSAVYNGVGPNTTTISFNYVSKTAPVGMGGSFSNVSKFPGVNVLTAQSYTVINPDDSLVILTEQSTVGDSYFSGITTIYKEDGTAISVTYIAYDAITGGYTFTLTTPQSLPAFYAFVVDPTSFSYNKLGFIESTDSIGGVVTASSLLSAGDAVYLNTDGSTKIVGSKTVRPDGNIYVTLTTNYNSAFSSSTTAPAAYYALTGSFGRTINWDSAPFGPTPAELFAYTGSSIGQTRTVQYSFPVGVRNPLVVSTAFTTVGAGNAMGQIGDAENFKTQIKSVVALSIGQQVTFTAGSNNSGLSRIISAAPGGGFYTLNTPLPVGEYALAPFDYAGAVYDEYRTSGGNLAVGGDYSLKGLNADISGAACENVVINVAGSMVGVDSSLNKWMYFNSTQLLQTFKAVVNLHGLTQAGSLFVGGAIENFGGINISSSTSTSTYTGITGRLKASSVETIAFICIGQTNRQVEIEGDFKCVSFRMRGDTSSTELSATSNVLYIAGTLSALNAITTDFSYGHTGILITPGTNLGIFSGIYYIGGDLISDFAVDIYPAFNNASLTNGDFDIPKIIINGSVYGSSNTRFGSSALIVVDLEVGSIHSSGSSSPTTITCAVRSRGITNVGRRYNFISSSNILQPTVNFIDNVTSTSTESTLSFTGNFYSLTYSAGAFSTQSVIRIVGGTFNLMNLTEATRLTANIMNVTVLDDMTVTSNFTTNTQRRINLYTSYVRQYFNQSSPTRYSHTLYVYSSQLSNVTITDSVTGGHDRGVFLLGHCSMDSLTLSASSTANYVKGLNATFVLGGLAGTTTFRNSAANTGSVVANLQDSIFKVDNSGTWRRMTGVTV